MKCHTIRRHLLWKLFLSHLIVVIVGSAVFIAVTQVYVLTALMQHVARSAVVRNDPALEAEIRESFTVAVNTIVATATAIAFIAAIITSSFVARRIVGPIQRMVWISQRIAAGDYHERIPVSSEDEVGTLAETFNRMAEDMEQAERRRLELIGNVAHELRTPLSSIKVMMEGLIDGVLPPEPTTYASFEREFGRLQRLVDDLQNLSRIESGQIVLNLERVAMAERITEAFTRLRPQFQDKHVDLFLDLAPDLPSIRGDAYRIMQVLFNLLGNALHYTAAGGQVTVSACQENQEIRVSIVDTGIGISAEHLPHIFERFYRVDKSRSRVGGGSGIGLTIAKYLVEAHGGHLWAASPGLGQGSTFTFTLPVAS
jgi:signal transduction histidine kinase